MSNSSVRMQRASVAVEQATQLLDTAQPTPLVLAKAQALATLAIAEQMAAANLLAVRR